VQPVFLIAKVFSADLSARKTQNFSDRSDKEKKYAGKNRLQSQTSTKKNFEISQRISRRA
jgi:hypothetical protein